jgi:hypothetical protein
VIEVWESFNQIWNIASLQQKVSMYTKWFH